MEINILNTLRQFLPLLVPIVLIQIGLMIIALVDLARRPATRGPKWMWVLLIVLINFIGPIAYFIIGRTEEYRE
jgi:hypothetical protein